MVEAKYEDMSCDVVIAGCGVAGLYAALNLPTSMDVVMLSKGNVDECDSMLAQGGICVLPEAADYEAFYADTMRAGHYENRPESVDVMIRSSQSVINDLVALGTDFERKADGSLDFTREGAHSRPRIAFHADITGKEITTTLLAAVRRLPNVRILEHVAMVDILEQDGRCAGVVAVPVSEERSTLPADELDGDADKAAAGTTGEAAAGVTGERGAAAACGATSADANGDGRPAMAGDAASATKNGAERDAGKAAVGDADTAINAGVSGNGRSAAAEGGAATAATSSDQPAAASSARFEIRAANTIWATGGIGGVYDHSTNYPQLTGDACYIATKHGIKLEHLDYVQIHPTGLFSRRPGRTFLISESCRGEGAVLLNAAGERFTDELQPRDVVAAAITRQMKADGAEHEWLSFAPVPREVVTGHFTNIRERCLEEGRDILDEPIPVVPTQHYFMGGVWVDEDSATTMPGLYAAGETACNGVHGKNRLASNSLLESLVFARRAAYRLLTGEPMPVEQAGSPSLDGLHRKAGSATLAIDELCEKDGTATTDAALVYWRGPAADVPALVREVAARAGALLANADVEDGDVAGEPCVGECDSPASGVAAAKVAAAGDTSNSPAKHDHITPAQREA